MFGYQTPKVAIGYNPLQPAFLIDDHHGPVTFNVAGILEKLLHRVAGCCNG